MTSRGFGRGKQPLSAKAASLLADLKAHAPERQSAYIGNLVETAEKRKRASELAIERKIAREAEEEGAPTMNFVTKSYEEKIQAAQGDSNEPSSTSILLRGAERVDASAVVHRQYDDSKKEVFTSTMSSSSQKSVVDAAELIRRRDARRAARKAPPSRLTQEMIDQAKERAVQRLGLARDSNDSKTIPLQG